MCTPCRLLKSDYGSLAALPRRKETLAQLFEQRAVAVEHSLAAEHSVTVQRGWQAVRIPPGRFNKEDSRLVQLQIARELAHQRSLGIAQAVGGREVVG